MNILQLLGIGSKKRISQGTAANGTVTGVQKCWWIKINTKPMRRHALDGALFPHIISYQYEAAGKSYSGRQMISAYARCPQIGEAIPVYYDPLHPEKASLRL